MLMKAGIISRIHVNQHIIRKNRKDDEQNPPLSLIRGGRTTHHMDIEIHGPSKIIYAPYNMLSCGAAIWIETLSEVEVQ
jgi:hypothetical protein